MQTKYSILILAVIVFLAGCSSLKHQDQAPIRLQEANNLYIQGELTQSEAIYRQLVKQSPGLSIAWFQLGNIYVRTHQLEAATDAFQSAIRINPDDERYWTNLILTQIKQAEFSLSKAKKRHPDAQYLNRLTIDLVQKKHESAN